MRLLKDIRVLDLGGFITGPHTAALLADFGADVVKVERPTVGDPFRALRDDLYSPQFQTYNPNKRSLCLDYTKPDGLKVLLALARTADIVVMNSRPGAAEKLGIGYRALHEINPRLIYCSITGFGPDGPYAQRPAFDHVGQALSGWMSRHRQNEDPRVLGPVIADRVTSYYATLGILAALHEREHSGLGRLVETNMLEASIAFCIEPIAQFFATNQPVPLYQRGASSQAYNLTCKDGKRIGLHMSSPDKFWHSLCRAIDREDWIKQYPRHTDRVRQYEELANQLDTIFRTRARVDWIVRLEHEDVPFAPEHEVQDVEHDPQVRHLDVFYTATHPIYGEVRNARRPISVDSNRTIDYRPPPGLGEHSDEILRDIGITLEDIARLRQAKIV